MSFELEALLAIGGFVIVLGAILLVPGLWWAKSKAKSNPDVPAGMRLTKIGYIWCGIFVAALFMALSADYIWPNSMLGEFSSKPAGRLSLLVMVILVSFGLEKLLSLCGIKIRALEPSNDI